MKKNLNLKNLSIAHRGLFDNINIPENSLLAFKKAKSKNIPIELDIQLTKDNVLIVFHDDNLQRMTGLDALVKDKTYSEIKDLHLLTTSEKIPTLKEVLTLIDDKVLLDIEFKSTSKISTICNLFITEAKDYHNFIIKSFNPFIISYFKKNYPSIPRGLLLKNNQNSHFYYLLHKLSIKISNPDFLSPSKKLLLNKNYLNLFSNYPLLIWTIKSKKEKDSLKSESFGFICNNLPFK